jgi:predicted N-acyltransferase
VIVSLDGKWRDSYDSFICRHSEASFFHQQCWLETLRDVLHKPLFVIISVNPEDKIKAVLPLSLCPSMVGRALVSVPFRDQGGPLINDLDFQAFSELVQDAKNLAFQLRASRITFQRVGMQYQELLRSEDFLPQMRGIDSTLDLSISEEDYWWRLKSPVRWSVKKARKLGLDVTVDDNGSYLKKFFDLFLLTRQRLGVATYPLNFFQKLFQAGKDQFKLLVAKTADGTIGGGLVLFHHGDMVYSGYIGYSQKYLPFRIVDILFYEAISWARRAGARKFLFGTDSIYQESLVRYKRKWLPETAEVYTWHWTKDGKHYKIPDTEGQRFRLIRSLLRRSPRPLFLKVSRLSLRYWE